MTLENAQVTKGLMLGIALTSIFAGIFDVKHYLHLQLVPHISQHHQYWRLFTHHLACPSSSDLLLTELTLYHSAVHIERAFGSIKFASFILIAALLNTISTFLALITLHLIPVLGPWFNSIPPGPTTLAFAILYQYSRLLPEAYEFKIFGVVLSDKIWVYATAAQLVFIHAPVTVLTALIGLVSGYVYRSDLTQLKGWRVPYRLVVFSKKWIRPLLWEERTARRLNTVFPPGTRTSPRQRTTDPETITTARTTPRPDRSVERTTTRRPSGETVPALGESTPSTGGTGVMRQWMSELTGGARAAPGGGTVRVPNEAEIQTLTAMFPDISREVILGTLQRSTSIEAAAETLLSSSQS